MTNCSCWFVRTASVFFAESPRASQHHESLAPYSTFDIVRVFFFSRVHVFSFLKLSKHHPPKRQIIQILFKLLFLWLEWTCRSKQAHWQKVQVACLNRSAILPCKFNGTEVSRQQRWTEEQIPRTLTRNSRRLKLFKGNGHVYEVWTTGLSWYVYLSLMAQRPLAGDHRRIGCCFRVGTCLNRQVDRIKERKNKFLPVLVVSIQ